jgi:hypothetical protein
MVVGGPWVVNVGLDYTLDKLSGYVWITCKDCHAVCVIDIEPIKILIGQFDLISLAKLVPWL